VVEIATKVEELKKLVGGAAAAPADDAPAAEEAAPTISLPSAEDLADTTKTPKAEIIKLGKELNIELPKVSEIRATLVLASKFAAGETLDPAETALLAKNLGLEVSKKQVTNAKNIAEYLSSGDPEPASEPDAPEETSSDDDAPAEAVSDDDAEKTTDDDAPEAAASDDDEAVETVADDDASEAATDDDATETPEAEGPSDADVKKAIAAYNGAKPKKPLKPNDLAGMRALLTDDKDVVHPMGEGYTKDGTAWACGFPLQDLKDKAGNELDYSKCRVTGKYFKYDADEELVEYVKGKK
jgi:hypothetical protein